MRGQSEGVTEIASTSKKDILVFGLHNEFIRELFDYVICEHDASNKWLIQKIGTQFITLSFLHLFSIYNSSFWTNQVWSEHRIFFCIY